MKELQDRLRSFEAKASAKPPAPVAEEPGPDGSSEDEGSCCEATAVEGEEVIYRDPVTGKVARLAGPCKLTVNLN